jgi:hypothetical protein
MRTGILQILLGALKTHRVHDFSAGEDERPSCRKVIAIASTLLVSELIAQGAALAQPAGAQGQYFLHRVRPGDTLFTIAQAYMDSHNGWRELQSLNRISDPYHLPPGNEIRVPFKRIPEIMSAATVVFVRGIVSANHQPLQVGMGVHEGVSINSGDDSTATLLLDDDTRVTLPPSSVMTIKRLRKFIRSGLVDIVIDIKEGSVESSVAPRGTGVGQFEIRTPFIVAGVRGTRFIVESGPNGSRGMVYQGTVKAQASRGSAAYVSSGNGIVASTTGALGRPRPLLLAPALKTMSRPVRTQSARIEWSAVPGAIGYKVGVAADRGHTEWLSIQYVDRPEAVLTGLTSGNAWLVVSAIDAHQIVGMEASAGFTVDLGPPAPFVLQPIHQSTQYSEVSQFAWAEVTGAMCYEYEIARDFAFSDGPIRMRSAETRAGAKLDSGVWWWHIRSVDQSGAAGPWTDPIQFKTEPAAPEPIVELDGASFLNVRWDRLEGSRSEASVLYRVQLAKDKGFNAIVTDVSTFSDHVSLPMPPAGVYFVRVARELARAETATPVSGRFSEPQKITVHDYLQDSQRKPVWMQHGFVRVGE